MKQQWKYCTFITFPHIFHARWDICPKWISLNIPVSQNYVSCEKTHLLMDRLSSSSESNFLPQMNFFMGPIRWKSESARSGRYGGCSKTSQPYPCSVSRTGRHMQTGIVVQQSNVSLNILHHLPTQVRSIQYFPKTPTIFEWISPMFFPFENEILSQFVAPPQLTSRHLALRPVSSQ